MKVEKEFSGKNAAEAANMAMQKDVSLTKKRLILGARSAAMRGEHFFVHSYKEGPNDRGIFRNSWRVIVRKNGADLDNLAPHAGIVELGSRPHWPPFEPIYQWVMRKLGRQMKAELNVGMALGGTKKIKGGQKSLIDKKAKAIARAVQKKIAKEGTKPHHVVKNNLGTLEKFLKKETERVLKKRPKG